MSVTGGTRDFIVEWFIRVHRDGTMAAHHRFIQ